MAAATLSLSLICLLTAKHPGTNSQDRAQELPGTPGAQQERTLEVGTGKGGTRQMQAQSQQIIISVAFLAQEKDLGCSSGISQNEECNSG